MYCYIIGERSIANLTILGSQLNLTERVPESYESTVRNASASDFRAITTSYLAELLLPFIQLEQIMTRFGGANSYVLKVGGRLNSIQMLFSYLLPVSHAMMSDYP